MFVCMYVYMYMCCWCVGWFGEGHAIVTWQTSANTPTGTYRFVVNGSAKGSYWYEYSHAGPTFYVA
jgi:hypothetical protein